MRLFRNFIPLLAVAGLLISGCIAEEGKPDEKKDSVELTGFQESIYLSYDGSETASFKVVSGMTWSVTKSAGSEWLTISPANGGANTPAEVTISVAPNDDLERSASFTFYCASVEKTATVTQAAMPIVPEIDVRLEEKLVPFLFNVLDPVQFVVWSNVKWTVEKSGLDWLDVTPAEGERKTETLVTLTPSLNEGAAREGTLTFKAEGATDVVVKVTQTEFVDDPFLTVNGIPEDGKYLFANTPEAGLELSVVTNRSWTATKSEGLDWIDVSPSSGDKNIDGVTVTVTASPNTGSNSREGTITFTSSDASVEPVVLAVSQEGKILNWIWTLKDEVLKATTWASKAKAKSDNGVAEMEWITANDASCYSDNAAKGPIVSSKGEGHYAYKGLWTDDNLQFTIPVKAEAGHKVTIKFGMSATKHAPSFWMVEYKSGDEWIATEKSKLTNKKKHTAEATFVLKNADDTYNITQSYVCPKDEENIQIRLRCVNGKYPVDSNDLGKAHKSGTIRIRQWSDGSCDQILISYE
ncbi:MAG: BACON domain-containing protein [Candidatus Cryptobacteroides sp.]|nr:BACON domain-containing protein [Candidatus Cryptobacteroides sp.]